MWKILRPTLHNAAAQALYWGCYSSMVAYASVFLSSRGLSSGQIGLILALGNALSVLVQPLVGNLADRSPKMILRKLLAFCLVPMLAVLLVMRFVGATFICYILAMALMQTVSPLLYSLCMFYINRGVDINFGISRGIGSLGYAAVSSILGVLTVKIGPNAPVWASFITMAGLLALVVTYRFRGVSDEKITPAAVETKEKQSMIAFMKQNRRFLVMMAGSVLLYVGYCSLGNFMYQIVVARGLSSADMGVFLTISSTIELPAMFLLTVLNKRFPSGNLMKVGAVFMVIKPFLMLISNSFGSIVIAMLVQFAGFPLFGGIGVYFVNQTIDEDHRTLGQSLLTTSSTLGNVIACLAGGVLIDRCGVETMQLVFVIASAVGAVIVLAVTPRGKKLDEQ